MTSGSAEASTLAEDESVTCRCSDARVGGQPPYRNSSFSEESLNRAAAFVPRPSDVFITTAPKTGTTWLQQLCHALRTSGLHEAFDDIYQVSPWDQMAWDLGQDLDTEHVANPRVFKTHLPLTTINRGGKYLCTIRNVEDTLLSWWNFLKEKDVPPIRKYASASEFVFDEDFVTNNMKFGVNLWQYYAEFAACLDMPEVLVLCFEDLVDDLASFLPLVADFMGLETPLSTEATERVLQLCSREGMIAAGSKFDESWTFVELQRLGRSPNGGMTFSPAARVRSDTGKEKERFNDEARAHLESCWAATISPKTGCADYPALQGLVRAEVVRRQGALTSHGVNAA